MDERKASACVREVKDLSVAQRALVDARGGWILRTDGALVPLYLVQAVVPGVVDARGAALADGVEFGLARATLAFVRRGHVSETREETFCEYGGVV